MIQKSKKSNEEDEEDLSSRFKQVGVFITIPIILAVSPIIGWLIGSWLDEKFSTKPYLTYLFLVLGFIAGFRELYRIIKRFGNGS